MHRTHLSLYYLVGYLSVAGLALLLVPGFALSLLVSNGHYGDVMPRLAGMLLIGLAVLVGQIIRLRLEALYSTTLAIRGFFLVTFIFLFAISGDPFFLVVFAIVAVGVILTGASYLRDRGTTDA
ncbi:MAG: hypothetical protein ABI978_04455 [Chloroflexota bacterium]